MIVAPFLKVCSVGLAPSRWTPSRLLVGPVKILVEWYLLLSCFAIRDCRKSDIPSWLKPSALVALTNALAVLPAHAEAGKIFDFNATLPIMVGQFLLLMFFLDKFWFGPVGKVLDERDALIRNQLGSVKVCSSPIVRSS
jgi:hypothetical protein